MTSKKDEPRFVTMAEMIIALGATWVLFIWILANHSAHPHVGVSASKESVIQLQKSVKEIHDHLLHGKTLSEKHD